MGTDYWQFKAELHEDFLEGSLHSEATQGLGVTRSSTGLECPLVFTQGWLTPGLLHRCLPAAQRSQGPETRPVCLQLNSLLLLLLLIFFFFFSESVFGIACKLGLNKDKTEHHLGICIWLENPAY